MRHRKKSSRLGRTSSHLKATVAAIVCGLVEARRVRTTLPKAKVARSLAEKMVTLGRKGTLAARRQAIAALRNKEVVAKLFNEIAPGFNDRAGGYTRITRLGPRKSDGSEMAVLEWVGTAPPAAKKKRKKEEEAAGT